jgi:hypothetical protein
MNRTPGGVFRVILLFSYLLTLVSDSLLHERAKLIESIAQK